MKGQGSKQLYICDYEKGEEISAFMHRPSNGIVMHACMIMTMLEFQAAYMYVITYYYY